ncbi:hypothetical protein H7198_03510 [Fructobacillus sp. CRL 2054]|uniref:hypothetical protein n=1 Tax=Fructobacillus sp. CRL 2054 TaxID=2763007 RepID=UPI002378FE9B|nr:hypothetical protein [Fructobacillus sp. CRL 2054]MDD9138668.1 hypothetical protein [Fructobacillus sp. CRL 2054]
MKVEENDCVLLKDGRVVAITMVLDEEKGIFMAEDSDDRGQALDYPTITIADIVKVTYHPV